MSLHRALAIRPIKKGLIWLVWFCSAMGAGACQPEQSTPGKNFSDAGALDAARDATLDHSLHGDRNTLTAADTPKEDSASMIWGVPHSTQPMQMVDISIDGQDYAVDPHTVVSERPAIFQPGYFSVFDVLVALMQQGDIELEYHFDAALDTHVVDALNQRSHWWYNVYYHGGWSERSTQRMDTYPVKDRMYIRFEPVSDQTIQSRYDTWRTEVSRRLVNRGQIVVPEVRIRRGPTTLTFTEVLVTAHNTRVDFFAQGTISAADIVQSLTDRGELSYMMQWYERIAGTEIKSYFFDRINSWSASGGCGFVYEVGELGDTGNHVHIPADLRVLHSPGYALFYWIELGPC